MKRPLVVSTAMLSGGSLMVVWWLRIPGCVFSHHGPVWQRIQAVQFSSPSSPSFGLQEIQSAAQGRYEAGARHHPSLMDQPSQVCSPCCARHTSVHSWQSMQRSCEGCMNGRSGQIFWFAGELRLVAELGVPVLVQCLGVAWNILL